eukprot:82438_1
MSPTTHQPTTASPSTFAPTTTSPSTTQPTTNAPSTSNPTTTSPTTHQPTTASPSTFEPTTSSPTITTLIASTESEEGDEYRIIIEINDGDTTGLDADTISELVQDEITGIDITEIIINEDSIIILFTVSSDTDLDEDVIEK